MGGVLSAKQKKKRLYVRKIKNKQEEADFPESMCILISILKMMVQSRNFDFHFQNDGPIIQFHLDPQYLDIPFPSK